MYKSLQSCRAIAAVLVLLFHLGRAIADEAYFNIQAFKTPFSFGNSGVEFFFVLSGFIIYYVHKIDIGHPNALGQYLYKRVTRIYPTYIIIFLSVYFAALAIPSLRENVPQDMILIIQALLLIPLNKEVVGGTGAPVLFVAWTLQYEMMFYLAFAMAIINRLFGIVLIGMFVLGALLGLADLYFPLSFIFNDYVWLFLMGVFTAWLIIEKKIMKCKPFYALMIGLIIYALTAFDAISGRYQWVEFKVLMNGISFSLIVFALVRYEIKGKVFLKYRWAQLIGAASYALYLIHYPVISTLSKVAFFLGAKELGLLGAILTYVSILLASIIISIIFHLYVEKPISKKLKAFTNHRQQAGG